MQINYVNDNVRRATAPFWYAPDVENTAQDMDVPPVYAPYPRYGYWPDRAKRISPANASIAPNSAQGTTVASSLGDTSVLSGGYASTPQDTVVTGLCVGGYGPGCPAPAAPAPVTSIPSSPPALTPRALVAPMPSIIRPLNPPPAPSATCEISDWVSNNTGLAVLAAVAIFALAHGGLK